MSFNYEYARPAVTVDILVFSKTNSSIQILLIKRGHEPFKDKWALPGGFIEMDEELITSAYRELKEETGIKNIQLKQFKTYGKIGRDPRGRTVSIIYYGFINQEKETILAGDDASEAAWFPINKIPPLAFDHSDIIADALREIEL